MEKSNIENKTINDIPKVKKSIFKNIGNWYGNNGKTILKTIIAGAITSTAIAGTLITSSMAFSIGLLPTLVITSCYVTASAMSGYIFEEEFSKLRENITFSKNTGKKFSKPSGNDKEVSSDKKSDLSIKKKTKLDVPEVKESKFEKLTKFVKGKSRKKNVENVQSVNEPSLDIPEVKKPKFEKLTKFVKEKSSKKKVKNVQSVNKPTLDIPELKESKIQKLTKFIKGKFNKKKVKNKQSIKKSKSKKTFNFAKKIFNVLKPKDKKKRKSKFITGLSSIGYGVVGITSVFGVALVLGLSSIFGPILTAIATITGSILGVGSLYKIYNNLTSIVDEEEIIEDEFIDEDEMEFDELEECENNIKNLNINCGEDILKAELVEEDKLGDVQPKREINNLNETDLFELDNIIDVPENEIILVEEPKVLSLSK